MMKPTGTQRGFILVASIWVMAALILMVSAFALWVETSLNRAITQDQYHRGNIDAIATRDILLYIAATEHATTAGINLPDDAGSATQVNGMSLDDFLGGAIIDDMGAKTTTVKGNELAIDASVYKGLGVSQFSALDLAGLIPVNSPSTQYSESLLSFINTDPATKDRLVSTLQDYIDKDDVLRVNGAETFQYQQRKLPPPPNTNLFTEFELQHVLGWKDLSALWSDTELLSSLTTANVVPYNINAMPRLVAQIAFDLDESAAEKFIEERQNGPYQNFRDVSQRTGLNFFTHLDKIRVISSQYLRFSFWPEGARLKREIDVYFLPTTRVGDTPWIVSRDLIVPISESDTLAEPKQPQTNLLR
ncbi:type II secretion system protein GspK [Aestuariibacter sp. A3R04]|uniref:type II secretion system protein GspK n=1 Tax=Aestuariibacter sp. A3R04 TaxID=2841571 RepID=UPI001C0880E6|nr:type II secretion system protein GspK [Aestuariibacter sp. A3R04]MBU3023401.1 general secretion pathway protein GspK [Aestuariibacter sp. A3R04]